MKIKLGKVDFRTGWQGAGCNKLAREPGTQYIRLQFNADITRRLKAFNVVLTGDHVAALSTGYWR